MVATSHMWLLGAWNTASETEELSFYCYLILFYLNLNYKSPIWLKACLGK